MLKTDAEYFLAPEVHLIPIPELPELTRAALERLDGDYVITRLGSRSRSRLLKAPAAELLKLFREPRHLTLGITSYGAAAGRDPEQILNESLPLLTDLHRVGWLIRVGDAPRQSEGAIQFRFTPGDVVDGYTIERGIQLLEDTEIYRCRNGAGTIAALKLARPPAHRRIREALTREYRVLEHLAGRGAPRPLGLGRIQDCPYFFMSWIEGQNAERVATHLRNSPIAARHHGIATMLLSIAEAYAKLHELGVIHGDIHPRNIIIDAAGQAILLDFGYARMPASKERSHAHPPRGMIAQFRDPEYAQAVLENRRNVDQTPENEQYALGALFFLLATGEHYLDFSLDRKTQIKEVIERIPRSFAECNAPAWPGLESIVMRMLSKAPEERFPSMLASCAALRSCSAPYPEPPKRQHVVKTSLFDELATSDPKNFTSNGPRASLSFGAAGIAYVLYRLSLLRADPTLLSAADLWITHAQAWATRPDAFLKAEWGISADIVGVHSLLHGEPGVLLVAALISKARHDEAFLREVLNRFTAVIAQPCTPTDLTLGSAGGLLAAAHLLTLSPGHTNLRTAGAQLFQSTSQHLDSIGVDLHSGTALGIAHGIAGLLYASLAYCAVTGGTPRQRVLDQLHVLRRNGVAANGGLVWPRKVGRPLDNLASTWCNGGAGFVLLWLLADRFFPDHGFDRVAQRTGDAVAGTPNEFRSICCGRAGQAYALLQLYRATRDEQWLNRAHRVAPKPKSIGYDPSELSLFKTDISVHLLLADLDSPLESRFPGLEIEPEAR